MSLPVPQPGEVIRYSYLWRDEHLEGQEEGLKDRPCAVVMNRLTEAGSTRLVVLPITHSRPAKGVAAVEIPQATKARLGLDDAPSWIILQEANRFTWPGTDIRPFDGLKGRTVSFGYLPPGLFKIVRDGFLSLADAGATAEVERTE